MASSSELIEVVSRVLAVNRSTCSNIYRELRTAGLVSNEGRGRHAAAMSVRDATSFLIAVCTAEQVQDAADAIRRYSGLIATSGRHASGIIVPSPTWRALPRLAKLPTSHEFGDALSALIDSYVESDHPETEVRISLRGPYPWAGIVIKIDERNLTVPEIWYSDNSGEDDVSDLARIDESKERQRRKFIALGGDLSTTANITHVTLAAIGALLRHGAPNAVR